MTYPNAYILRRNRLRGTGRTTRMIDEAIAAQELGRIPVIVAADAASLVQIRAEIINRGKFSEDFVIVSATTTKIDWTTLSVDQREVAHCRPLVFFDHYTIERHLAKALEELQRYDPPEEVLYGKSQEEQAAGLADRLRYWTVHGGAGPVALADATRTAEEDEEEEAEGGASSEEEVKALIGECDETLRGAERHLWISAILLIAAVCLTVFNGLN